MMTSSGPVEKHGYIDLLRGIAILGVIAVHCHHQIPDLHWVIRDLFNYGQLGVQLFFVASALTLCLSMESRKEASWFNFYIRRFFRIAPLYYFAILLYFFWRTWTVWRNQGVLDMPPGYTAKGILENLFFVHGFDPANFNHIVPGGWSIATEISFYSVFPALFRLQSRIGFNKFLSLVCLTILLSFVGQLLLIRSLGMTNDVFGFPYCTILNQLPVFLIGILIFQRIKNTRVGWKSFLIASLLCGSGMFLLNTTEFKTGMNGFFYPILSSIGFGIFALGLAAARGPHGFVFRFFGAIGRISFSSYILHFLFLELLVPTLKDTAFGSIPDPEVQLLIVYLVVTGVTFVAAKGTEAFLERPAIEAGRSYLRRDARSLS